MVDPCDRPVNKLLKHTFRLISICCRFPNAKGVICIHLITTDGTYYNSHSTGNRNDTREIRKLARGHKAEVIYQSVLGLIF